MVAALVGNTPSLWHAHILPLGAMGVTISHLQLIFSMKPLFSGGGGGGSEATVRAVEGSMVGSAAGSAAAASVDVARAGQR